jgi:hypothetical protein
VAEALVDMNQALILHHNQLAEMVAEETVAKIQVVNLEFQPLYLLLVEQTLVAVVAAERNKVLPLLVILV